MSNLIAFQRTFDPGHNDDNWYHNFMTVSFEVSLISGE